MNPEEYREYAKIQRETEIIEEYYKKANGMTNLQVLSNLADAMHAALNRIK